MAQIAFIGLGKMGIGMAGRLLDAGHRLTLYNRSAEKAAPLVARGAALAATPKEAADGAEAIFAMLGDDLASRACWLGPEGALAGDMAAEAFAVECSTLSHDWVMELAASAHQQGLRYIDCPVTGLPDAAAAGELILLAGAEEADWQAAGPLLAPLCREAVRFGPVGTGSTYKLMINLMGAVQIAAAAEGLLIAEKAGLDLGLVVEVLAKGQAAAPQVVRNARRMVEAKHDRNIAFTGRLRLKDTLYGVALAEKMGQAIPFGQAAAEAFQRLVDDGDGELSEAKVIDALRS